MSTPVLSTKFYIPPLRSNVVFRPRLIERLNEGLHCKLTLISAPAGFGKTTLVSEWVTSHERPTAWLSLDEGDNDPIRFLAYLVAALQMIAPTIGVGVAAALQAAQPPPVEALLTTLVNEINAIPDHFALVLDDYHLIDAQSVDSALIFLLKHLPPQMHLVIVTREDPQLPVARLRTRGQLIELRAADLRFTLTEAAGFLNQVMGLSLSTEDITALETRTEGWIAGLQLAALALHGTISIQGHQATSSFIQSFTGSHHFVLDYLVEEVLQQQSEGVQNFLLKTSILDRLCGPLCDAVLHDASGQAILEYIEHANLFIVPMDNERRWYRYHHLFADLLRQRLRESTQSIRADERDTVDELHLRASIWYEAHGFGIESFHHAAAAHDIDRAARLIDGEAIPLHHGAISPILQWLGSLATTMLDSRPSMWVRYASLLMVSGHTTGVEEKLQAAEAALLNAPIEDGQSRNLIGQIAALRATLSLTRYQVDEMFAQAHRALEYLPPDNMSFRAAAMWILGYAYYMQGDRSAALQVFNEGLSISQTVGNIFSIILTGGGLARVEESDAQLFFAFDIYQRLLKVVGEPPIPVVAEIYVGLARIFYEWNDLEAAQQHVQQALTFARQMENVDTIVDCEICLARLRLARGDVAGSSTILARLDHFVRQHNFTYRMPEVAAVQVLILLQRGNLATATQIAHAYELPISQARIYLAGSDTSAALAVLESWRQQSEARHWMDEQLKAMVLQAVVHHVQGEHESAMQLLHDTLVMAEPGGFIRLFVDEGILMYELLLEAAKRGVMPEYTGKLLAAFEAEKPKGTDESPQLISPASQPLIELLSERELEVLQLIAQGLSNHEISERLFLALDTVKGHNRRIFDKLQVQRRTEAVARARELGLL